MRRRHSRGGRAAENNNVSAWHRKWREPDGREKSEQSMISLSSDGSLHGPVMSVMSAAMSVISISDRITDIDHSILPGI